jgi:serine/threonine-protein kinase
MDFGIAKRPNTAKALTQAGMMAGTPQYMSPEQINDFASVTHLADLYALGCIAFQMFTGQVPFEHEELVPLLMMHVATLPPPPRARNPRIPPALEAIMLQLLAKNPAHRVQSCRALAELLGAIRGPDGLDLGPRARN